MNTLELNINLPSAPDVIIRANDKQIELSNLTILAEATSQSLNLIEVDSPITKTLYLNRGVNNLKDFAISFTPGKDVKLDSVSGSLTVLGVVNLKDIPTPINTNQEFLSTSLPGFYAMIDIAVARASNMLWTDISKTTIARTAGQLIGVIKCPYSKREFLVPSDPDRGTLANSGELWWIEGSNMAYDFASLPSIPLSAHFAFRPANVLTGNVGICGPAGSQKLKMGDSTKMDGGKEGVTNWTPSTTALVVGTDYVGGLNYGATGDARYYLNGIDNGVAQTDVVATGFTTGVSRIGANLTGTERFSGRFYAIPIFSEKQSVTDILRLHKHLGLKAGLVI